MFESLLLAVPRALSSQYAGVHLEPILALLTVEAEIIEAPALPAPTSADPEDHKFFARASADGSVTRLH